MIFEDLQKLLPESKAHLDDFYSDSAPIITIEHPLGIGIAEASEKLDIDIRILTDDDLPF